MESVRGTTLLKDLTYMDGIGAAEAEREHMVPVTELHVSPPSRHSRFATRTRYRIITASSSCFTCRHGIRTATGGDPCGNNGPRMVLAARADCGQPKVSRGNIPVVDIFFRVISSPAYGGIVANAL